MELSDGTYKDETGKIENLGTDKQILKVDGIYTFIDRSGISYTVIYTADEKGYHPRLMDSRNPAIPAHLPSAALASLAGWFYVSAIEQVAALYPSTEIQLK